MTSTAITQAGLNRLMDQATSESVRSNAQLALTPYEYGLDPSGINDPAFNPSRRQNPTMQDQHPSAQRLASAQMAGKTSQINHAQAAQPGSAIWVTVPVDKVVTTPDGAASATPVYASTKGYIPRPGESRGSIPPPIKAGHPYH